MPEKMDLSLEDIIKMTKKPRGGGRGGARGRGSGRGAGGGGGGGVRGGGVQKRSSIGAQRPVGAVRSGPIGRAGAAAGGQDSQAKLLISNLDFGVTDADIRELFSEFGRLRRAAVHYDRSGRSLGTAEVFFDRYQSAAKAQMQYNRVPLDGRPMDIELLGSRPIVQQQQQVVRRGAVGSARGRIGRGGGGRGGGGRGGGGNRRQAPPSKEELDAELDKYTANADE